MRIRIFRAASLADAMAQVRDELGLDALILGTETRAGLFEVTAALDTEDEPEPAARFDPLPGLAPDLPAFPVPATQAMGSLSRHNLPPALLSALGDGPLDAACSRLFRFSRLPLDADGAPLLLTGPPGGGKTADGRQACDQAGDGGPPTPGHHRRRAARRRRRAARGLHPAARADPDCRRTAGDACPRAWPARGAVASADRRARAQPAGPGRRTRCRRS